MDLNQFDRISSLIGGESAPAVRLSIHFTASAVESVLDMTRSVMKQVAKAQTKPWPSDDQWHRQLPDWFIQSFVGNSQEEMLTNPNLWDFGSWLDAMKDPGWEWWSANASATDGVIECSANAMPYAIKPLLYLLRVAGAEAVDWVET